MTRLIYLSSARHFEPLFFICVHFNVFISTFVPMKYDHYPSGAAICFDSPLHGLKPCLPQHLSVLPTTQLIHFYCCESCSVSGGNFIVDVVMTVMKWLQIMIRSQQGPYMINPPPPTPLHRHSLVCPDIYKHWLTRCVGAQVCVPFFGFSTQIVWIWSS